MVEDIEKNNFLDKFQEMKKIALSSISRKLLESTIQFFYDNSKEEPTATGSGVLLTLDNRYFMITAAHVIAENYNGIFVILPDVELVLGGTLHFTPIPEGKTREDDKIDFAILELEPTTVGELKKSFTFLTIDDIELNHQATDLPYYFSLGYPATKTKKVWNKPEIKAIPYPYQTEHCKEFEFSKFGFQPTTHLALKFDGKVTSTKNKIIHNAPTMNGISGSGQYYLYGFPKDIKPKLIGITIEGINFHNNQALIGTRIDLVTEFMRQRLGVNVPTTKLIRINLSA